MRIGVVRWAGMVKLVLIELMLCGRAWERVARRRLIVLASPLRLWDVMLRVNAEVGSFGFEEVVFPAASRRPAASREADAECLSALRPWSAGETVAVLRIVMDDMGRGAPGRMS